MSSDQHQADVPAGGFKMDKNADKQCRLQFHEKSRACKHHVCFIICASYIDESEIR